MKSNSLFSRTVVRLLAGIAITGGVVALAAVSYRQFFKPADTPQVERLAVVKDKPVASIKEAKPAVEAPTPEPSATPTPEPERKHPSAETTVDDLRGKKFTDKEEIFEALPSMVDGEKRELESERDGKRGKKEERRERKLGLNDRYKFIGSITRLIPQSIKDLPARVDKSEEVV